MNICMITSEFPPDLGGISTYVYNLSKKLVEKGHQVTVITRSTWKNSYFKVVDGISVYHVRFIPSLPSPFWLHGIWVNNLFKKLEPKFDLIHVHGSLTPIISTCLPLVFTCHGTSKKDLDNMPVKSFHFLITKMLYKQLIHVEQKIIASADIITAVSNACAKELKKYYDARNVTVVYNGVDTNLFIPSIDINKSLSSNKTIKILYTGRLESRKGLIDFVESAKYVCKEYADAQFILTGNGTIKKYLEKHITSSGLESHFYFAGYVDRAKLIEYYQKATIYVLPSYYEGLPTTLLEAMSCGVPSIATDVEGSSEVISNENTGLLVPPRNPRLLGEAIIRLLNNELLQENIKRASRAHIVKTYDWDCVSDRILNVYQESISLKSKQFI